MKSLLFLQSNYNFSLFQNPICRLAHKDCYQQLYVQRIQMSNVTESRILQLLEVHELKHEV